MGKSNMDGSWTFVTFPAANKIQTVTMKQRMQRITCYDMGSPHDDKVMQKGGNLSFKQAAS